MTDQPLASDISTVIRVIEHRSASVRHRRAPAGTEAPRDVTVERTRAFLRSIDLPDRDPGTPPASRKRFPDGAQYRVEIPSVEGPEVLAAVLAEADRRGVPVHRVSQGSGTMLLTDAEVAAMASTAAARSIEVSLFTRPLAGWDTGAAASASGATALATQARGTEQLVYCLEDLRRAAVDIPLDIYVESPDDQGGFVRHFEIAEIVRVAAPVYLKFGLRNAPNIYPSGSHLATLATALGVERVRRAEIGLGLLARYAPDAVGSTLPAADLAVPEVEV
jgi:hypothetical protein